MYYKLKLNDKVRVPPERMGEDLNTVILDVLQEQFEGSVDKEMGIFIAVVETTSFGAFISLGPIDAMLHMSQITDEYIDYDEKNSRLVCKDTGRTIAVGDRVRARVVALSLNEREPRESKIGLTMRQPGLGTLAWIEDEREKAEKERK